MTTAGAPVPGAVAVALVVAALLLMGVVSAQSIATYRPGGGAAEEDGGTARTRPGAPLPPPKGPVTLVFGGDVHFESWLGDAVLTDPTGALDELAALFADADLAVVNLETAVTEGGTPAPKRYTFRAPTAAATALASAGVDVVSLANNHGMDYGVVGLTDTLRALGDAGVRAVGAGMTSARAYRPYRTAIRDRRIAVIGATQVLDGFAIDAWNPTADSPGLASAKEDNAGLDRLLAAVRRADRANHTVVVMLHWGEEKRQCPLERQQQLAAQLRSAGADVIVGGHSHRLGPGGLMDDTVVHYGLGNLVFYTSDGPGTVSGALAVTIDADDATEVEWRPAVLRAGVATPLDDDDRDDAVAEWDELRSCTRLSPVAGGG